VLKSTLIINFMLLILARFDSHFDATFKQSSHWQFDGYSVRCELAYKYLFFS